MRFDAELHGTGLSDIGASQAPPLPDPVHLQILRLTTAERYNIKTKRCAISPGCFLRTTMECDEFKRERNRFRGSSSQMEAQSGNHAL
jgi:hypothetical protein